MIPHAIRYAQSHQDLFLEDLKKLVRIPSVSFPGFPANKVRESAQAVAALLKARGLEHVQILELPGAHPYVYGDWLHAKGRPTLLLYAHHDVQPVGRTKLWKSPPFVPTERKGRLYGRGSADDKAGVVVHTSAVASYLKSTGKLPLNIKVIIEGEEEIGSQHLEKFLSRYAPKLQADVMVLTDTNNFDTGIPSITTALRGLASLDVEVRSADHPLHSGMWGGPLVDPVQALSKIISSLSDTRGRIAIPGIYEEVQTLSPLIRKSLRSLKYTEKDFKKQAQIEKGVHVIGGSEPPLEKMWWLPSLSVNAIQASSRKDVANIINESAWCHIGIRIVPHMSPQRTLRLLENHIQRRAPWGVQVRIHNRSANPWWVTKPEGSAFQSAQKALSKGFGREAVFIGCGGSIPFVGPFSKALGGAPALLIGVEDPYSNPHSENESLHLGDFRKAILGAVHLYGELIHFKK
ncbi:MAG: M20/M25/M40 family metallo-hydrolase [Elusimicrobia bacterium]|nr:M20/M25/M40 family metallo-hydrolase [Elusimicrobiota bacterium]